MMKVEESAAGEPLLISMLEHFSYCPRQCALIHVDDSYRENIFTIRGSMAHRRVDKNVSSTSEDVQTLRALPLWSDRLGLVGRADVVEIRDGMPYPVEYKSGAIRDDPHADLQLSAQALCLEEMFGVPVPQGAVYHMHSRKRRFVEFTSELKQLVVDTCTEVRAMLNARILPPPVNDERCIHCSLEPVCLPELEKVRQRAQSMWRDLFHRIDEPGEST